MNILYALDMSGIAVTNPYVTHLAFFNQAGHLFPCLLDVFVRFRPVHLIQVYPVHAKSFQAVVTFLPDTFPFQAVNLPPLRIPQQPTLGCNKRFVLYLPDGLAHDFFRMAAAVNRSGIYPVNALFHSTIVTAIQGQDRVESVKLKDVKSGAEYDLTCDGVFIFVGMVPNTAFLNGFVELTENGLIKCDYAYLRTSVPGVFAAGDCRVAAAMQLVTAASDGVVAAMMLGQYFMNPGWWDEAAGG